MTSSYLAIRQLNPISRALQCAALITVFALFLSPVLNAQVKLVDKIVAVVDDDIVLASELESRVNSIKQRFEGDTRQLPPESVLQAQVIERLIVERIQLQMAQRAGIQITDEQVNQSFVQLAQRQGVSPNQLMASLNQQGQSVSTVLRDLRQELLLQQVQQGQVNRRIFISEADVDTFLDSAEGQFWKKPSLNMRHIQINLPSNAAPGEVTTAENLANQIFERLKEGDDFEALAVQYSAGATALEGGEIGWRRSVEFPPEITEVVEELDIGEFTAPIRSSGGIHLFQLIDTRGGVGEEMIQQTKTRHILVKPNEIRSEEEAREIVESLRERIANGEDFEELAKEYSEDIANSLKGGDLGWVLPGQMVEPFEAAMNETDVEGLSEPVETRFGWHLLQVEDRRKVDMSSDILRNQARNVLRSRRFQEELDLWTREIRNDAFVKITLPEE